MRDSALPLEQFFVGAVTALLLALAPLAGTAQSGNPFTAGIEACNNVAVTPALQRLARYSLVTGELDLPLVFAPGLGWYRATLDPVVPAATFRLREAIPVCEVHPSPATYLRDRLELYIPEVEAVDQTGVVAKYEATLRQDPTTGLFQVSQVWDYAAAVRAGAAGPGRKLALAGAEVPAVLLTDPVGPYAAGDRIPLTRIGGGRIGNPEAGCEQRHLHGTITIDRSGPYADPRPGNCGFGIIVTTDPSAPTSVIDISVPSGTNYCGPDITKIFLARLRIMTQRLAALPGSEKGVFDGTMFLARNGQNADFEVGAVRDPMGNSVCPTEQCRGTGHTSTFTLCGRCMMSHIDNDIEFGVIAQLLGVPRSVQLAGAHAWDVLQGQGLDPLPSQAAYAIGNLIGAAFSSGSDFADDVVCAGIRAVSIRTGLITWTNAVDLFQTELSQFNKQSCQPCPYGCPEALIRKDFATQAWELDDGRMATYPPR